MLSKWRIYFKQVCSVAWIVLICLGTSCSGAKESVQNLRNQEARLTRLIDDRRYPDVIRIVEGNAEAKASFSNLLAMAYLGNSGFEPLRFATQVVSAQELRSSEEQTQLERIFPGCDSRALQRFERPSVRCVLKRIWTYLPDANEPDFAQARALFRSNNEDIRATSQDLNTLIATVEAASALSRTRKIALHPDGNAVEIAAEAVLAANDAIQALERIRYSTRTVSKLLTGLDLMQLFESDASGRMNWVEGTGMPLLMRFSGKSQDTSALLEKLLARMKAEQ